MSGSDPLLRRLERSAVTCCGVSAAAAWVVGRGNPDVMLGVLGGGLLIGTSYWVIRSSVTAILACAAPSTLAVEGPDAPAGEHESATRGPRRGWQPPGLASILLRLAWRYALLSFMAYVMIARFRLHPVGLLLGVSSLFAAVSLEAVRTLRAKSTTRRM